MSNWQVVTCPHCEKPCAIKVDSSKYRLQDVHLERKPFSELHELESERNCFCERCAKAFYVTLILKSPPEKKGVLSHKKVI